MSDPVPPPPADDDPATGWQVCVVATAAPVATFSHRDKAQADADRLNAVARKVWFDVRPVSTPPADDPGVGPDAARHTPPPDDRPPRDFPDDGSFAITRSLGSLRVWRGTRWRWDGHDWQPVVPAPPDDDQAARAEVFERSEAYAAYTDPGGQPTDLAAVESYWRDVAGRKVRSTNYWGLPVLLAEYDRRAEEIETLRDAFSAGMVSELRAENQRDTLSGLLRGMARRASEFRRKRDSYFRVAVRRDGELGTLRREERQVRAERDDLRRLLSAATNAKQALADAYIGTHDAKQQERDRAREAIANRDSSINRLLGQVAAARALHAEIRVDDEGYRGCVHCGGDYPCDTLQALDGPPGPLSPAPKDSQTLDGPAEAPTTRYELGCVVCATSPYFRLEPFETNDARQAWADAHQAATGHDEFRYRNTPVSAGPAEAAEPPRVCSKCGTAGCVEDAESGWYDG